MQQTVTIRKVGKQIRLSFPYNTALIDIMREHKGYFYGKEKVWCFPTYKLTEIKDELTKKMYNVRVSKEVVPVKKAKEGRQLTIDPWEDPKVVSVYGYCVKCKQYGAIDKGGLCVRCK